MSANERRRQQNEHSQNSSNGTDITPQRVLRSSSNRNNGGERLAVHLALEDNLHVGTTSVLPASFLQRRLFFPCNDDDTSHRFLSCLLSGQPLSEPYMYGNLKILQTFKYNSLKKCNLKVKQSKCLVGAPDPLGVLEEGQVFIMLSKRKLGKCQRFDEADDWTGNNFGPYITGNLSSTPSSTQSSLVSDPFSFDRKNGYFKNKRYMILNKKVIVFRHPVMHVGDIRVMEAIFNKQLYEFSRNTSAGIIFFSTKGKRSDADKLSGGDYDGDRYTVIFDDDWVSNCRQDEVR
jgi:hypothetical protein